MAKIHIMLGDQHPQCPHTVNGEYINFFLIYLTGEKSRLWGRKLCKSCVKNTRRKLNVTLRWNLWLEKELNKYGQ